MGMNLAIRTSAFAAGEKQDWLGSQHGTQNADSITLKASAFAASFPTGTVPSGVVLGKITATGLYAPYLTGNVDGTQTPLGHLFTTVDLTAGGTQVASDTPGALLWHGEVVQANLPTSHGLDAGAITALKGSIKYV
jgi:hypothetical protein